MQGLGWVPAQPNPEALQTDEALRLARCLHIVLHVRLSKRFIRHLLSAQHMGG